MNTRCATSSSQPAQPDLATGKGTPGTAQLFIDDDPVGQAVSDVTVPIALGIGSSIAVGRNPGSPVSQMYSSPFAFSGSISTVTVSLAGDSLHDDDEAKQGQARVDHGQTIETRRTIMAEASTALTTYARERPADPGSASTSA